MELVRKPTGIYWARGTDPNSPQCMEMSDLPPLKNISLLPVPAPVVPSFVPFTISTGQCCILPKSLLRKVWHPYQDPVGQCHCEPGGWCNDLPCAGQVQCIPCKIWGHGSLNGGSQLGWSCCGTDKEPCDQPRSLCGEYTPTRAPHPGSLELWVVGAGEGGQEGSSTGLGGRRRTGLFWDAGSQVECCVGDQ